ncbi:hypothetical protein NW768_001860 [Fusarium equiseti]|uniref:Uncharacterized protein n=1 Tax=Fusarium equiseti TaxID=61235 RepID=A0ABQ8RLY6_FUSEQ|nr:hypothetical protein NW768_001860 [Fusarium equiseti]
MRHSEQTRGFWDYYTEEDGSKPYMELIFSTGDFWVTLLLFTTYSIFACVQLIKHSPPPVFRSIEKNFKTSNDTQQTDASEHIDDSFLNRLLNWDAPISDEELSDYPYLCRFCENETLRLGAVIVGSLFYPLYLVVQAWWTCCLIAMVLPQFFINQSHLWKFYSLYLACWSLDIVLRMVTMLLIQVMLIWMIRAQTRYMRTIIALRLGPEKCEKGGKEETEKDDSEYDEDEEDEEEENEEVFYECCGSNGSFSSTHAQYAPSSPSSSCMNPFIPEEHMELRIPFWPERPPCASDVI